MSLIFLRRFITIDETWIHYYTPETKEVKTVDCEGDEPALKKAKMVLSAGKMMAIVFWDNHEIVFIDYLEKSKTITRVYYASLFDKIRAEIAQKRLHLEKKKVLFHQNNAPAHTSAVEIISWSKLMNCSSNWLTIHHIQQIWALATFSCFLTSKFGSEIFIEWGGHRICSRLFCRTRRQLLFGKVEEVTA